jgi:hypothetical protein
MQSQSSLQKIMLLVALYMQMGFYYKAILASFIDE